MIILFMFCVFYNKQPSNKLKKSQYVKKHNIYNPKVISKTIYISVPKNFPISFNNIEYLLGYPPAGYKYEIYYGYKLNNTRLNNGVSFNQVLNISKNLTKKGINNQIIGIGNSYTIAIDNMDTQAIEIDNGLSDIMDTDIILKDIYGQGFMAKQNKYLLESSKAYSQSSNFVDYHLYFDKKKGENILKNKTKIIKDVHIYSEDADNIYNTMDLCATPTKAIASILDYIGLGTKYYKNINMNSIINSCNRVKNNISMNILVNDQNEVTIHIKNDIKDYQLNNIIINKSLGIWDQFIIRLLVSLNPNISVNELNRNTSKNCNITHLEKDFFSDNKFNLQVVSINDLAMYQNFIKRINIVSNYSLENNQKIQKSISSKVFLPIEYINMLTSAYQHMSGHKDLNPDVSGHDLNLMIPVPKKEIMVNKDNIINRFGSKNGKISLDILQKYWINYNMLYHVKLSYLSMMIQNKDIKNPIKLIKNIGLAPKVESKKSIIIGNIMHYLTFNFMWSGLKPILLLNKYKCFNETDWSRTREKILLDLSNINFSYEHRLPLGINSDLTLNMEINTNNINQYTKYKDLSKKISKRLQGEILKNLNNTYKMNKIINSQKSLKSKGFFRQLMNNNLAYKRLSDQMNLPDIDLLNIINSVDELKYHNIEQIFFKPQLLSFLKFTYRLISTNVFNIEFNIKNQLNKHINNKPEIYFESTLDFILDQVENRDLQGFSIYTASIVQEKYSLKDHSFAHQYSFKNYADVVKFDNMLGAQYIHISPIITTKKLLGQNIIGLYFASVLNSTLIPNANILKKSKLINQSIVMCEVAIGIILSIMGIINLMICIYLGLDHEGKMQYDLDFKKINLVASQLSQKLLRL